MHSVILYFGSFNPVHRGHIALAEEERLAMVRLAAAASRYSRRMRACDVEFSLPRPSYTVDTLSVLTERYPDTTFSLLVGSDIPGQITQWKEWRKLLDNYKIYVYPRRGYPAPAADCGFTVLEGAPFEDYSSTEVRTALTEGGGDDGSGCCQRVYQNTGIMEYRQEIERLTAAIEASPEDMTLYAERGKIHFRAHDFGSALNDFNRVLLAEEHNEEIRQYVKMINEILEFRYNDIYNP